jgi:hypothetical protein
MTTSRTINLMFISAVLASAAMLLVLAVTNPRSVGPYGVTAWFVVFLVGLGSWLSLIFYGVTKLWSKRSPSERLASAWRQGLLLASWVTILLALSSLGQLGIRDVLLTALLLGIVEFYWRMKS